MAVLTIRNLPEEVRNRLRLRAAKAGRSMEAEVREILAQATRETSQKPDPEALQAWVTQIYGQNKPEGVVDELIRDRRKEADSERQKPL